MTDTTPTQTASLKGAAIVFDLDGTLIDTAPDLARSANEALLQIGRPMVDTQEIRPFVGRGARVMIERGLALTGGPVAPETLDELVSVFIDHYQAHIAEESRPFPGMIEAVDRLITAGAHPAICTNKREGLANTLMAELKLDHKFQALIGGDTLATRKPDAAPILEAISRVGGSQAYAVMVGDTIVDTTAAKAAGVPVVAVSFGYSEVPVGALGADAVIHHFDALWDALVPLLAMEPEQL